MNMEEKKVIGLIYHKSQSEAASRVRRHLLSVESFEIVENLLISGRYSEEAAPVIDTAVVFICDEAATNIFWQREIENLEPGARIIPVAGKLKIDTDVLPERVREINFIPIDGQTGEHVLDSVISDPGFYDVKNYLLNAAGKWLFSEKSSDYLIIGLKTVGNYTRSVRENLRDEKDMNYLGQLNTIAEFLNASRRESVRRRIKDILSGAAAFLGAAAAVAAIFAVITLIPVIRRASMSNIILQYGNQPEIAQINALKILEGETNPFSPNSVQSANFDAFVEVIDMPWSYSRISPGYKWGLNDVSMSDDITAVWTANGDGAIAKWDRVSADILEHIPVSQYPLYKMDITPDEKVFAAADTGQNLFVFTADGSAPLSRRFEFTGESTEISRLVLSKDAAYLAVVDNKSIAVFNTNGMAEALRMDFNRVHGLTRCRDGFAAVTDEGEKYYYLYIENGAVVSRTEIPAKIRTGGPADIFEGLAAFVDDQSQLLIWDEKQPETVRRTGFILRRPLIIEFIDENTLAYNDRYAGTRIADITACLDLGPVLTTMPTVVRLVAHKNQLVGRHGTGGVFSQDLTEMLPLRSLAGKEILREFTGTNAFNEAGIIRSAETTESGMVKLTIRDGAAEYESYFDARTALERPTVIGLLGDGDSFLIAASNGDFFENQYLGPDLFRRKSFNKIPSRSAIQAVYLTPDSYYLLDGLGLYWPSRVGYTIRNLEDMLDAVRDKNRFAYADDLRDAISPGLIERLGILFVPGADGREWE